MKYRLLTKEQLEALPVEFSTFLASQQIDAKEWKQLNKDKPKVVLEELQVFSDFVWEDVLTKVSYLEHSSEQHLNLFKCEVDIINRIYIKIQFPEIDLTTTNGLNWLMNHLKDEKVEAFKGSKSYNPERNIEIFKLIEQGSVISKDQLYEAVSQLIA
ncbi:MAG: DUF6495 family protein [Flavobacteriaceae bacterium]|nr:DUF6495 family protein [Flavobacteriaceae bacterium]